jgi:hypothetical protein
VYLEVRTTMDGLIASLEKNPVEQILVSKREYRGHAFIDVRIFFEDDTSEWRPTRQGVTLSADLLEEFKAVIAQVELEDAPVRRR